MSSPIGTIYASGATYSFHVWEGQIEPMSPMANIYARLGQLGQGVQKLGATSRPSRIRAFYLTANMTDAVTLRYNVMQLVGSFVNVSEPSGVLWTGALIAAVSGHVRAGFNNFGGASYPLRVELDITILAQQ